MGYTTDFTGVVEITPPLNEAEVAYLTAFSCTRRMRRTSGPYYVEGAGFRGQDHDSTVLDYNEPPPGQPGLWCQWVPTDDGSALEWDQGEKFYYSPQWMTYIIDHFLRPGGQAQGLPGFEEFTFDHVCNGEIYAQGEEPDDRWVLVVKDNEVRTAHATITYADPFSDR